MTTGTAIRESGPQSAALANVAGGRRVHPRAEALVLRELPLKDLPELSRGKGNKLINVPTAAFKAGEEEMISAVVLDADGSIAGHYRKMHIPDDPGFYGKFYFSFGFNWQVTFR